MGNPNCINGSYPVIGAVNCGELMTPDNRRLNNQIPIIYARPCENLPQNNYPCRPQIMVVPGCQCRARQQINQTPPIIVVVCPDSTKNKQKSQNSPFSEKIDKEKKEETFKTIDKNNDGSISKEEFEQYFVQHIERNTGIRFTNTNDPELAKAKKMAENVFDAIKDKGKNKISKERFDKIIDYYDKASDGKKDGKINLLYLYKDLEKLAYEGKDTKLSDGKTLEELIA